jgi:hypothetical protein
VISSAYSIYQEFGSHFERRVIFRFFSLIFSFIYIAVASHSIFGLVAIINSSIFHFLILAKSSWNFKSFARIQLIGEIEPHKI